MTSKCINFYCSEVSKKPQCIEIRLHSVLQKKQSQEVDYKKGVLKKFRKIHGKTPVLESLYNKVAGLRPATLLNETSTQTQFDFCFEQHTFLSYE